MPTGGDTEQHTTLISTDIQTAPSALESFLDRWASTWLRRREGQERQGTPGAPALDKSPDHAERESFKEQAHRLMSPGDLLSFFLSHRLL